MEKKTRSKLSSHKKEHPKKREAHPNILIESLDSNQLQISKISQSINDSLPSIINKNKFKDNLSPYQPFQNPDSLHPSSALVYGLNFLKFL